ncbi:MOB member 4, phocein, partial [Perkinsus olseni]
MASTAAITVNSGGHYGEIVLPGQKRCDFLHGGEPDLVLTDERPLAVGEYLKGRIRAFLRDPTLPALIELCRVPSGVSPSLWCVENIREFMVEFNRVIAEVQHECNEETCPRMSATDEWHFLCAAHRKPMDCCAIDYMVHTVDGSTNLILSSKNFPERTKVPQASLKFIPTLYRRLYRIFGHLFHHHRAVFFKVEGQSRMCARFTQFVRMHGLLGPSSSGAESSRSGSPVESNLYLVPDAAIGLAPPIPPVDTSPSSNTSPEVEPETQPAEVSPTREEEASAGVEEEEASDTETGVAGGMSPAAAGGGGFASLGLSSTTLRSLARMGYEEAAPVQRQAIPLGLSWTDLIIQSKSGSGKTCAFGVIICELTTPEMGQVQSIVIAPSREIVNQIRDEMLQICHYSHQVVSTVGELKSKQEEQQPVRMPDILIGTSKQVYLLFRQRRVPVCPDAALLVFDEADIMLDNSRDRKWLTYISRGLHYLCPDVKLVLSSATMPPHVLPYAEDLLEYLEPKSGREFSRATLCRSDTTNPA